MVFAFNEDGVHAFASESQTITESGATAVNAAQELESGENGTAGSTGSEQSDALSTETVSDGTQSTGTNIADIIFSVGSSDENASAGASSEVTGTTSESTATVTETASAGSAAVANTEVTVSPAAGTDNAFSAASADAQSTASGAVTEPSAAAVTEDASSAVSADPIVITEMTENFPIEEPVVEEFLDEALEAAMREEIDEDLSDEQGRDPDAWLFSEELDEVAEGFDTRYVRAGMSGNELKLFRFLTERLGLNTAAACGVLANVYCESGFYTGAVGDRGTSVGICQWHNGRKKAILNYLDENNYERTSLAGQMFYMREELCGGYRAVYDYLLSVPDTAEGAYQAARYFCLYYEIPANRQSASKSRGNIAKKTFWAAYAEGREEVTVLVKQAPVQSDAKAKTATTVSKTTARDKSKDSFDIDTTDTDAAREGGIPDGIWILGLQESYAYDGEPVKPDIRVYDGVKLLTKNEDYKVAYQHYDEVGTAKIRITTIGDKPQEIIREYRIAYTEETAPKILPTGFSRLDL